MGGSGDHCDHLKPFVIQTIPVFFFPSAAFSAFSELTMSNFGTSHHPNSCVACRKNRKKVRHSGALKEGVVGFVN